MCPDVRRSRFGDAIFALITRTSGMFVLLLLGAIIVVLFLGGFQAFRAFGFGFLISDDWDPVRRSTAPPCRSSARS